MGPLPPPAPTGSDLVSVERLSLTTHYSYGERLWAYLQLLRPANLTTSVADVLAGFAASGAALHLDGWTAPPSALLWLVGATIGLYGGGVVFNDVFDADLDADERPERPLPSGRASRRGAALLGGALLLAGLLAAGQVSGPSAGLAAFIALAALLYDAAAKDHPVLGPLNMGLCRGGNLLLGISAVPALLTELWFLALIPVLYIAAITAVSQGEVHGGTRRTGLGALGLVALVIGSLLLLGVRPGYALWAAVPFTLFFAAQVVPPFVRALRDPAPAPIQAAVKAGVLALIPLNAALAAGFAGWLYGLVVLLLLPFSIGLARLFAVT